MVLGWAWGGSITSTLCTPPAAHGLRSLNLGSSKFFAFARVLRLEVLAVALMVRKALPDGYM